MFPTKYTDRCKNKKQLENRKYQNFTGKEEKSQRHQNQSKRTKSINQEGSPSVFKVTWQQLKKVISENKRWNERENNTWTQEEV